MDREGKEKAGEGGQWGTGRRSGNRQEGFLRGKRSFLGWDWGVEGELSGE
jgi:hypothetical protein